MVHTDRSDLLVLGLYVTAPSLESAERTARALVLRALGLRPPLLDAEIVSCGVPLVAPFYDLLLSDGAGERYVPLQDQDRSER
ncbi:hypothetical protein [Streptomyces caeruleatus]|uniref:Uncharacterized protein n=1 Tax=Streptomyces caeruleatus TaxID=661399 RepID=A0A117RQY8_9ACTN|nr:hypothetical protein [Streptomyces caeruleatus]KUO04431.1 hypothetical protein AQJ67_11885 [Streptomyces caeruleatus]